MASCRSSGQTATDFANESGVVEATLRWWAWRLGRDGELPRTRARSSAATVGLVPVRVLDSDGGSPTKGRRAEEEPASGVEWTLRTPRGELTVYSSANGGDELRAAVTALLGNGS